MLDLWLAFFILGNLGGRLQSSWSLSLWLHGPWFGLVTTVSLAALGYHWHDDRLLVWRSVLIAALASGWGLAHAAADVVRPLPAVQQVVVAVSDGTPGPMLVQAGEQVFESYGRRFAGALGSATPTTPDAPRLFSRFQSHVALLGAGPGVQHPLTGWAERVRRAVPPGLGRAEGVPRGWLAGLLLGAKRDLPPALKQAFKQAGVYHLLIVSGLHVTIMVFLVSLVVRGPLHLAYALRLIPASWWPQVAAALRLVVAALSVFYLAVAGMPVAAQRATLLFVCTQLSVLVVGALPLPSRLLLGATLQTLIFPVGFVSEATLMTWGAYLTVVQVGHSRPGQGLVSGLKMGLSLQLRLLLLVAGTFGQVSGLGLGANLCLVPLLGVLLASGLLVLFLPQLPGLHLLLAFHATFAAAVRWVAALSERWPGLAPPPGGLTEALRPLALLLSAVWLLNACRDLTIRRYDLK